MPRSDHEAAIRALASTPTGLKRVTAACALHDIPLGVPMALRSDDDLATLYHELFNAPPFVASPESSLAERRAARRDASASGDEAALDSLTPF